MPSQAQDVRTELLEYISKVKSELEQLKQEFHMQFSAERIQEAIEPEFKEGE